LGLVICYTALDQQCGTALSSHFRTVAMPSEWSIVLALHCSRTVTTYLHALQALIALPARTSCRPMMALTSGALEMCARALGTCVSSCTGSPTRLFFMLESHGQQGAAGHMAAPEPTSAERRGPEPRDTWQRRSPPQRGGEVRSHETHGSVGAHLSREARSGAIGHVAASEPISAGRRGPEP
jgi:hypothetical protein